MRARVLLALLVVFCGHSALADERIQVPAGQYPFSAVGRVNWGHGWCSGVLIGPDLVATAAHCLTKPTGVGAMAPGALRFVAGWDRGDFLAASQVVSYRVAPGFTFKTKDYGTAQAAHDWALLKLAEPLGEVTGWVAPAQTATAGATVAAVGYGRDRRHVPTAHLGCHLKGQLSGGAWLHDCDAVKGDSGGPILAWTAEGPRLVGLHVASLSLADGGKVGGAVGIETFLGEARSLGAATESRSGKGVKAADPAIAAKFKAEQ